MKLSEKLLDPGTLISLRELPGGHKGKVFKLENDKGEKLVVKFQKELPVEALAGTRILQAAGVQTAAVRKCAVVELGRLTAAIHSASTISAADVTAWTAASTDPTLIHRILMEFAEGVTLKSAREDNVAVFLDAIESPQFQRELGMMVAADTFAGNPDRMFAGIVGFTKTPKGWYHEQNTFIGGTPGARRPVAIDNAFSPSVLSMQVPWGRYLAGTGIQTGSFASATPELSLQEGEMLFKALLKSAEEDHRDDEAIMQRIANIRATEGGAFAANFSKGATEAIQLLLTRGQHWKRQFAADGASDELLRLFKIRKRVIRLVSVGKSPAQAKEIASNDTEYGKWIVKGEDALLGEAVGEYNALKAMAPGK